MGIRYLNFAVPDRKWCKVCEEELLAAMSNVIQVISIFGDISLREARQELGPVHVVPDNRK